MTDLNEIRERLERMPHSDKLRSISSVHGDTVLGGVIANLSKWIESSRADIRTLLEEVDRQKKINEQLITGTWILEVDNHENPCTYGPLCPWCAIESLQTENARMLRVIDCYITAQDESDRFSLGDVECDLRDLVEKAALKGGE